MRITVADAITTSGALSSPASLGQLDALTSCPL